MKSLKIFILNLTLEVINHRSDPGVVICHSVTALEQRHLPLKEEASSLWWRHWTARTPWATEHSQALSTGVITALQAVPPQEAASLPRSPFIPELEWNWGEAPSAFLAARNKTFNTDVLEGLCHRSAGFVLSSNIKQPHSNFHAETWYVFTVHFI